jgi:hypothetical protein
MILVSVNIIQVSVVRTFAFIYEKCSRRTKHQYPFYNEIIRADRFNRQKGDASHWLADSSKLVPQNSLLPSILPHPL